MDQVKLVMRQIVIHRFWVLSGVITLVGLGGWWLAVGALLKEYDTNKGKIEGQYSAITAVRGVRNHPNDFSHRKMEEIQNRAKQQVAQAWVQQYQQQVGVLVWPQRLQRDFEAAVINLRPAEKIPFSTNYQQDIEKTLRARYRDYIQEVLPQLATIINSNWDAKAGAGGMGGMSGMGGPAGGGSGMTGFGGAMPGMGPGGGGSPNLLGGGGAAGAGALPPLPTYVVQWNSSNQAAIVSRYDWSKQPDNVPNTLQILYAQEDFWILSSLMNIIARTNEGADAPYKAAVKVIEAIDLGTYAQRSGSVTRVGGGGAAGGMAGMPGMGGDAGGAAGGMTMVGAGGSAGGASSPPAGGPGPGGASGGGMMPGMMGGGMGGGATAAADPLEGRYVDVNLQPVKADTMRQALEVRTPQDALLAVVKRMPVRLQLTVDIRKLNRLLAECGNAQLPLEVRQVRINRQSSGGGMSGGGGLLGGGGGGGFSGMLGSGSGATTPGAGAPSLGAGPGAGDGMSAGGGMGGMGGNASGPLVATAESYEIKVEIFGLVYIYNPPNEKILGALQVPETAGPAASAPAATTSSVGTTPPNRS